MAEPARRWLPRKDLNLDKQDQNLLCYRYTTGQDKSLQLILLKELPDARARHIAPDSGSGVGYPAWI